MTWAHSHADLGWATVQSLRGKCMCVICLSWKPNELWCNTEQAEEQQDGAAGSGAALLWEVAFIRVQQGSGLTPQDKGQEAVSKLSRGCHCWICSKRNSDFSESSPPALFSSIHHNPCSPKPRSILAAQRLHCQSRNVLTAGPSVSLLAQLWHLAVTIAVGLHQETHKPWRGGFLYFVCHHTEQRQPQCVFGVKPPPSLSSSKEVISVKGFCSAGLKLPQQCL